MNAYQQRILQAAPKFRFYFTGVRRLGIIPDTPKGREWAVTQGATHLSALQFHRCDVNGQVAAQQWGDFCCTLISRSPGTGRQKFIDALREALAHLFIGGLQALHPASVTLIHQGEQSMGLCIPATFFGLLPGASYLGEFYKGFAAQMDGWLRECWSGIAVHYDSRVRALNSPLPAGDYAVPMLAENVLAWSNSELRHWAMSPRSVMAAGCGTSGIDSELKGELLASAKRNGSTPELSWRSLIPLVDEAGALSCQKGRSMEGCRCAIKLVQWFRGRGLGEFRQRDALRAVDGSYRRDQGVEEALRTLSAHRYIQECPTPNFSYPGRRTRWFVINPAAHHPPKNADVNRQKPTQIWRTGNLGPSILR